MCEGGWGEGGGVAGGGVVVRGERGRGVELFVKWVLYDVGIHVPEFLSREVWLLC